jgi:hypothetical protein
MAVNPDFRVRADRNSAKQTSQALGQPLVRCFKGTNDELVAVAGMPGTALHIQNHSD